MVKEVSDIKMINATNINEIKNLKKEIDKKDKQILSMANLNRSLSEQNKNLKATTVTSNIITVENNNSEV